MDFSKQASFMPQKLFSTIIAVTAMRLLLNTARRFVYPFAPAISRELEVPLAAVTRIIATSQFVSLLGLFGGPLADRFGYRSMMRSGLFMLAGGMLVCALAGSYWPLFIGLVVSSLGKTLFDPAIQAYVGSRVPYARRGRIIGLMETAWAGSTLLGIPLLGVVISRFGLSAAFVLFALLGAVAWLVVGLVIEKEGGSQGSGRRVYSNLLLLIREPKAAAMLLFGFLVSIANDALFVVYGAWLEGEFRVSLAALGFSAVAIGLAELTGEGGSALLADRLGLKKALLLGLLLAATAYCCLPLLAFSLFSALAGIFAIFLFFEFSIVTSFALCTEVLPEARATMMSGFYAAAGVGRMVGVLLGGLLWSLGGIKAVVAASAVCTLLALLVVLWGGGREPQSGETSQP